MHKGSKKETERRRCRVYYVANAERIKANRRARYRAKVLGEKE